MALDIDRISYFSPSSQSPLSYREPHFEFERPSLFSPMPLRNSLSESPLRLSHWETQDALESLAAAENNSNESQPSCWESVKNFIVSAYTWILDLLCCVYTPVNTSSQTIPAEPKKVQPQTAKPAESPKEPYHESPKECAICYEEPISIPVELSCGHVFGLECILEIAHENAEPTCPVCREDLIIKQTRDDLVKEKRINIEVLEAPKSNAPTRCVSFSVPATTPVSTIKYLAYRHFYPDSLKTHNEIGKSYVLKHEEPGLFWTSWNTYVGDKNFNENDKNFDSKQNHKFQLAIKTNWSTPILKCDSCFKSRKECDHV